MPTGSCFAGAIDTKVFFCYTTNMTTIILTDPLRASEAGEWAVNNIGYKYWTLQVENLFTKSPQYCFKFKHKKQAVEFALRWI
jgi:hypothetical protein